jgi:hypothetical protein
MKRRSTLARLLLSPAGAILTLVCFFLPWGRFSCMGVNQSMSGAQLGGEVWLVFFSALVVLAAGVAFLLRSWNSAWLATVLGSVLGLLVLGAKVISVLRGVRTPWGRIRPQDIGVDPHVGGVGTVLGLLLALGGALLLWPRPRDE